MSTMYKLKHHDTKQCVLLVYMYVLVPLDYCVTAITRTVITFIEHLL